MQAIYWA